MSAFGQGSLANYSAHPLVEGYAKKVITHNGANGNLVINSKDRFGGSFSFPTSQPYNNFTIQKGFPIQQGQIMDIKLSEILFPYAIPNVNNYNNSFGISNDPDGLISVQITVPTGFYTGATLASTINPLISTAFSATNAPTLAYNANTNVFTFVQSGVGHPVSIYPILNPGGGGAVFNSSAPVTSPSILSMMGFNFTTQDYSLPSAIQVGGSAPLVYTQYIDICSDVLTQYQNLPDASTGTPNHQHVICRLYIANETSTTNNDASGNPIFPGMTPFVIHRQFKNTKVFKWNSQNSVDRIDIQLYDDAGRLLRLPDNNTTYPDFQITFQSSE
jgi:hypothetical protein